MKRWIIGLAILFLAFFIYSIFNGTPWGKENMRRESSKYLQAKYGDEMTIESIEYDFKNSTYFNYKYYAVAHLKENSEVRYLVTKYHGELSDDYYVSFWEYEVKQEIREQFHQISSVSFHLRSDPSNDSSNVSGTYPPSYHEIKKEIKEEDMPELRLWFSVNEDKQEQTMNAMFEIVSFLKEKEYRLSSIHFKLDSNLDEKSFYLNGADFKEVTDLDSLTKRLR